MVLSTFVEADPIIGESYGPNEVTATSDLIRAYANATGDAGWSRHAAAMRLQTGKAIAPPTLFDRDMAMRLRTRPAGRVYSLHAKMGFEFLRPIEEGMTYTITGELTDTYTRNEIGYLQIDSVLTAPDGEASMKARFTQAFRFPGNQYKYKPGEKLKPTVNVFLEQNEAQLNAKFPDVGSVVEGPPRVFSQALANLYSGPASNIHTDPKFTQRRGHPGAIIQGLMSTILEIDLYRELFGAAWYTGGKISAKYINNMACGCCLTPIGVVASNKNGEIELRTAIYDEKLEITAVGTVSCKV